MKVLSSLFILLTVLLILQGCALVPEVYTAQDYREDYTGTIE